jgi:uncharacterized protein YdeI (YjbR/CyaY-like superfamily)
MAVKHNPQASLLITESIEKLEPFAQVICTKLRFILNTHFPELIEDWKWGPNYYCEGMVCGYWGFKKHASLVFFNGAAMKDPNKIFQHQSTTKNNRHIRYKDISEVDEKIVIAYVREAIQLNKSGVKRSKTDEKEKIVEIHTEFKKALQKQKLIATFNALTYYKKKELTEWINTAKRAETRVARINKSVALIAEGRSVNDKYR